MTEHAVRCDNCDHTSSESELDPIEDLEQRLDPSGEVPAGQCPKCGALAYLLRERLR